MGLNPLTIKDIEFPEGKFPELLIYDWGTGGKTFRIAVITRHSHVRQTYASSSDRSMSTRSFRVDDFPLVVMASVGEPDVRRGEIYVLVNLRLGGVREFCLLCGYISVTRRLTWPPGVFEHTTEGPGKLRSITGTDPAAGVEISETVPTNARWRLRGIRFTLVTDATVATRRTSLLLDDGTTILQRIRSRTTHAASLSRSYSGVPGLGESDPVGDLDLLIELGPEIMLFQDWRIRTSTVNLQAGDNFGAPQLLVEEWLEE